MMAGGRWALTRWGWDDVLPYFLKSEDHFGDDDPMHARWRRMAGGTPKAQLGHS